MKLFTKTLRVNKINIENNLHLNIKIYLILDILY